MYVLVTAAVTVIVVINSEENIFIILCMSPHFSSTEKRRYKNVRKEFKIS